MGAILSDCGRYRYRLWRDLEPSLEEAGRKPETVLFLMLNPSTADHREDDPTIRRCVGFARRLGYQRLSVGNLYAFRATDPAQLQEAQDPVGPGNDAHLWKLAREADQIVAAWGANPGPVLEREREVRELVASTTSRIFCLGTTKAGRPRHPLYLPKDTDLEDLPPLYAAAPSEPAR